MEDIDFLLNASEIDNATSIQLVHNTTALKNCSVPIIHYHPDEIYIWKTKYPMGFLEYMS